MFPPLFGGAVNKSERFFDSEQKERPASLEARFGYLCSPTRTYYALRYGDVSTVTPLMNVEPFFVFILAYLVLREQEKITYKLVIGTLFIVVGISLINMF